MTLERLFGSKGRAALLRTLFDGKRRKAHIREIALGAGLSPPSLMREAKNLVKCGLLREEVDGNRVDYFANTDSPLCVPLETIVEKTDGLEAALAEAFADSTAECAFIFGSRARGTARADSDCDIFVIGGEGLRGVSARIGTVAGKTGVEINPYVIDAAEFKRRLAAGDHFLSDVAAAPKVFLKGDEHEFGKLV